MSLRDQIADLEQLAAIDAELRRLDEQLTKERESLSTMRADLRGLEERLRQDRERVGEMERARSELVIELRQMATQIDRSREKLSRARNEREQMAAQRELEELRKLQRDREEEAEKLSMLSQAAHAAIQDAEGKRAALAAALEGSQEGITRGIEEVEAERGRRDRDRAAVVARVPPVLYRRYETIRARRPNPIARTHDGTCLGCHIAVPPMLFQRMLRAQELEQCPNCRRLLYYAPPPTAGE